ncbi:MAG TPA: hypothetical protein VEO54_09955 [Thermoanaerobaculia bacterium]|nr:hypothetical protein [Thermoanaerobaculia bacterium]
MRRLLVFLTMLTLFACKGENVGRASARPTGAGIEVKSNDNGFKLRTPDGKLLWKVKITEDKIKISDNEENQNPFELKAREGNRTKVFGPGEQELGNVRFDGSKIEVENAAGQTLTTIPASKPSAAYGVLLCERIPKPEKDILIAEILARGR